jgi:hypothetical protein
MRSRNYSGRKPLQRLCRCIQRTEGGLLLSSMWYAEHDFVILAGDLLSFLLWGELGEIYFRISRDHNFSFKILAPGISIFGSFPSDFSTFGTTKY